MSDRATPQAVKDILGKNPSKPLEPFIKMASVLSSWLDEQDTENLLSEKALERIESLLAAHFYRHQDQGYRSKSTGRSSGAFQGSTGFVLTSTDFGQDAILLDATGRLAQRSKQAETGVIPKASLTWLGMDCP